MNEVPIRFHDCELNFPNSPEFKFYSCFSSDSFALCLAIGIFEILARFKGPALHHTEKLVEAVRELIKERKKNFSGPDHIMSINYFEGMFEYINSRPDSFSSYQYILNFSLTNPGRNLLRVLKGFLLLLTGVDNHIDQGVFNQLVGYKTDGYENMLLIMSCKFLSICINVHTYEKVDYDEYSPMKIGRFPILHILYNQNTYYLIYTKEMIDHQKGVYYDSESLSKIPYIMDLDFKESPCQSPQTTLPPSLQLTFLNDPSNDLKLALDLLNNITKETKEYFSEDLKAIIRNYKTISMRINAIKEFRNI